MAQVENGGFPVLKHAAVRRLTRSALIAAVYAALTAATGFMSFGSIQFRMAEALCILPFFLPWTAWGLTLGCLLSNLLSPYGAADLALGTLATLLACCCVGLIGQGGRNRGWGACIAACAMPVLWNGLLVGTALTLAGAYSPARFPFLLLSFGGTVALGEAAVLFGIGLPLLRRLPGSRIFAALEEKLKA